MFILGGPGVGKGTLTKWIIKKLNKSAIGISVGDLLWEVT